MNAVCGVLLLGIRYKVSQELPESLIQKEILI
jgi:hypothetical protein